jgi:hypothetical protein
MIPESLLWVGPRSFGLPRSLATKTVSTIQSAAHDTLPTAAFGDFQPARPNWARANQAIPFVPVGANVVLGQFAAVASGANISIFLCAFLSGRARHICRKISGGLRPVDNSLRTDLNWLLEQGREASSQNGEDGGGASKAARERRGTAAITRR